MGGPPVRGTKLEAWRTPKIWNDLAAGESSLKIPEGSTVLSKQAKMRRAAVEVLESIAKDVRDGLLETVGVESEFLIDEDGRCAMRLELPEGSDAEYVARAIDAENIESWIGNDGKVCVGISPWISTKDVDQTVLCTIKVIHVILGIHATDNEQPKSLAQKFLSSVAEILQIQTDTQKKK